MQDAVRYARLVRPFPVKRLSEALWYVQQDAASIAHKVTKLLIDPPTLPEEWRAELDSLEEMLWSLAGRCEEASPKLRQMADSAEGDFERAVSAVVSMMRGLAETEWQSAEPEELAA